MLLPKIQTTRCTRASAEESGSNSTGSTTVTTAEREPDVFAKNGAREAYEDPFSLAQIMGSYVQVGVWIVVLSYAAYTGFQKVRASRSPCRCSAVTVSDLLRARHAQELIGIAMHT
jgi:hypothetical protein